jgi:hypothetical protein
MTATPDHSLARPLAGAGFRPLVRRSEAEPEAGSRPGAPRLCGDEDDPSGWIRLAPGFDWLRLLRERDEQLRGAGGHIRQSALCLDPFSAADCCRFLGRWPAASALRTALPLPALAQGIAQELGPRPLQVLVLGVGEGSTAARLGQELLWATAAAPAAATVQLCLCDPSVPLLCAALRGAATVLPGPPRLRLDAVAGPPEALSDLLATGPQPLVRGPPARLFALLGCALADLDDEARFLRYGLAGAAPGDLLLLDTEAAEPGPPLRDEAALLREPLSEPLPKPFFDWLEGLVQRARRDVVDIGWHTEPEPYRALPASQILRVIATVRCRDRDRRFVLYQLKRYEPEPLAASIERWGWQRLLQLRYGPEQRGYALLFRRRLDGERDPACQP